jgi:hypothetical protein
MRLAAVLFAAALTASTALPAMADAVSDAVRSLPASVGPGDTPIAGESGEVRTVTGRRAGQSGSYRVIIARDQAPSPTARVFVQWVAGQKVAFTVEVREFEALNTDIRDLNAKIEGGDLSVFIDANGPAGDLNSYELFVFGPNKYRFGKSTN